jgi:hypothetical protein
MLFNLVLDWVLAKSILENDGVRCSMEDIIADLEFADDAAIMQPDERSCQELLDRIADNGGMLGLRIKPAKTKAIYFHLPTAPALSVYGETIEVSTTFTYLGSTLSSEKVSASDDIASRIAKASAAFGRLKSRVFTRRDLTIHLKMKVYNASVLSVLLYASETWALTKSDVQKLEVFQMSALRRIAGISLAQRLTNVAVRDTCGGQPTVESSIRKRRLRWLGHVARMPAGRLCNSVWRTPKPPT